MELKTEFHGKVLYLDGDYGYQSKKEDLAIEIFMMKEKKDPNN